MSELTVENLDAPPEAELPPEPPDQPPPELPPPERHVAFQTNEEVHSEAAPKRRGRPKAEPKPKGEAKKRGRPPKPRYEEIAEPPPEPPAPIDLHALMEPLVQHYIQTSHLRRDSARRQQYQGLLQNMLARGQF